MIESPAADAIADRLLAPPVPEAAPVLRACLFLLAGSPFAVDVRNVREVAVFDGVTIVPRAPSWLLGVANLRGVVVPVVEIGSLLDLPARRPSTGIMALVIDDAPLQAAVVIEVVLGLESHTHVMPLRARQDLAVGLLAHGDDMFTLLDVRKILATLRLDLQGRDKEDR